MGISKLVKFVWTKQVNIEKMSLARGSTLSGTPWISTLSKCSSTNLFRSNLNLNTEAKFCDGWTNTGLAKSLIYEKVKKQGQRACKKIVPKCWAYFKILGGLFIQAYIVNNEWKGKVVLQVDRLSDNQFKSIVFSSFGQCVQYLVIQYRRFSWYVKIS